MRFHCYGCGKSVSSEVPDSTILRAIAWCPECIALEKDQDPEILAAARAGMKERCALIIEGMEIYEGSAAEGANEPEFSMYTHTEAVLHQAVAIIRSLKEDKDVR